MSAQAPNPTRNPSEDSTTVTEALAIAAEVFAEARASRAAGGASVLPPDAPVATAPAEGPSPAGDIADARTLHATLTAPTAQRVARAVLCGLLTPPIRSMQAARWTRIVEAGLAGGLWALSSDGAILPVRAAAPTTAPAPKPTATVTTPLAGGADGGAGLTTTHIATTADGRPAEGTLLYDARAFIDAEYALRRAWATYSELHSAFRSAADTVHECEAVLRIAEGNLRARAKEA